MNKRILVILLILIASVATSSVVFASETITVDGYDFNIPDGFKEDVSREIVDKYEDSYIENRKTFENDNDNFIIISVGEYYAFEVTNYMVGEALQGEYRIINGVEGYISYDDGSIFFEYAKDGKLIMIVTDNEDLIKDVVVE